MDTPKQIQLDLPVKPIEQRKIYGCGFTALLTALRYQYGVKLTQDEMELLSGATPGGSDEFNLIRALEWAGYKYQMSSQGSIDLLKHCLEQGQPPIVHLVMEDGGGHYMVVKKIDDENIELADPAKGEIVTYGIYFFMGVWKEEEKDTATHWYLVITGHVGDKLDGVIRKFKRIQKKLRASRR